MEHHTTTTRAEAERLLGIAEKLLRNKDLSGSKDFAILAQETEPLLEGPEQILAVADVLSAADKRVNNHHDWYSILQLPHRTNDAELIKKQYRRLALLLHPDKNRFAFSESAFGLVADAWAVLSDPGKKPMYDNEFSPFMKVDLVATKKQTTQQPHGQQFHQPKKPDQGNFHQKLSVRRSARGDGGSSGGTRSNNRKGVDSSNADNGGGLGSDDSGTYWTACPYCYNLYEYPRLYDGCCFRCQNCNRAFTGAEILSMPPMVPGKEAYYCCWGFFPMGFMMGNSEGKKSGGGNGYPNWMPPMFGTSQADGAGAVDTGTPTPTPTPTPTTGGSGSVPRNTNVTPTTPMPVASTGAKKRGRPRKNV